MRFLNTLQISELCSTPDNPVPLTCVCMRGVLSQNWERNITGLCFIKSGIKIFLMLGGFPSLTKMFRIWVWKHWLIVTVLIAHFSSPLKNTLYALYWASLPSLDSQENIRDLAAGLLNIMDIGPWERPLERKTIVSIVFSKCSLSGLLVRDLNSG